jgi:hypothetical protein
MKTATKKNLSWWANGPRNTQGHAIFAALGKWLTDAAKSAAVGSGAN